MQEIPLNTIAATVWSVMDWMVVKSHARRWSQGQATTVRPPNY